MSLDGDDSIRLERERRDADMPLQRSLTALDRDRRR